MSTISEGPLSGATAPCAGPVPVYSLFDSSAVAIGTFFGTPVVGGAFMAANYRRLGQGGKAVLTFALATVITATVIFLGWNLPQAASSIIAIALLVGMRQTAQVLQGAAVKTHVERGGALGSKWVAFGWGLAVFVVLFGSIFAAVFLPTYMANSGPKVVIGTKDDVYYSGTATKDDAQQLGNALKMSGYFSDIGADVLLSKEPGGTEVSFIVKEGIWNQPAMVASFEEFGRQIAPSVGGFPIELRLLNKAREVKAQSNIGRVALAGNDDVYYFGTASQSEGRALADALKAGGFFEGKGTDVFLAKHGDGTVLTFVVQRGVWDDPALVADFEATVRKAAPAVGGLPIRLHLDDTSLELKKDELIK